MPHFEAFLTVSSGLRHDQQALHGKFYLIGLAPPGRHLDPAIVDGYFFPNVNLTVLGRQSAASYGYDPSKPSEELRFTIRDLSARHNRQFDIMVRNSDVFVSDLVDSEFVRIGGAEVVNRFEFQDALAGTEWDPTYSYHSAPYILEMIPRHHVCYDPVALAQGAIAGP